MSRTCQSLGVCQHRTPPCRGCEPIQVPVQQKPIRFAPGVIQCVSRRRQRASLACWMGRALGVVLVVATVAFWAGLFSGERVMQNQATPPSQPSQYAGMSPEALLQECDRLQLLTNNQAQCFKKDDQSKSKMIEGLLQENERLQLLTNSQAQCNKDLHQSILKMIRAWARVIEAYWDQDDAAVQKALAVAIDKLKAPAEAYH